MCGTNRPKELCPRRVLEQVARGPCAIADTTSLSVWYVVRTSTRAGFARSDSFAMAVTPSTSGIRRSMRMTSGRGLGERDPFRTVRRFADDVEFRITGEHPAKTVPNDRMIVHDQEADRVHDPGSTCGAPIAGTPPRSPCHRRAPILSPGFRRRGRPLAHRRQSESDVRPTDRSGTSKPTPSSRTSRATTSPM